MARCLTFGLHPSFNRWVYTISYLQGFFVDLRVCGLSSVKSLNSRSCSGNFLAAGSVAEDSATDTVYSFSNSTWFQCCFALHWCICSLCLPQGCEHHFSETLHCFMRLPAKPLLCSFVVTEFLKRLIFVFFCSNNRKKSNDHCAFFFVLCKAIHITVSISRF